MREFMKKLVPLLSLLLALLCSLFYFRFKHQEDMKNFAHEPSQITHETDEALQESQEGNGENEEAERVYVDESTKKKFSLLLGKAKEVVIAELGKPDEEKGNNILRYILDDETTASLHFTEEETESGAGVLEYVYYINKNEDMVYKTGSLLKADNKQFCEMLGDSMYDLEKKLGEADILGIYSLVYFLDNDMRVDLIFHDNGTDVKLIEVKYKKSNVIEPEEPTAKYFLFNVRKTFTDMSKDIRGWIPIGSGMPINVCYGEGLRFETCAMGDRVDDFTVHNLYDPFSAYNGSYFKLTYSPEYTNDESIKSFLKGKSYSFDERERIEARSLFYIRKDYDYETILSMFGEPYGITEDNRVCYLIDGGYVFFQPGFSEDETMTLDYMDIYSESGEFRSELICLKFENPD